MTTDGMMNDFASIELFNAHLKLRDPDNHYGAHDRYKDVADTIIALRQAQSEIRRAEADIEIARIRADVELAKIAACATLDQRQSDPATP